MQIKIEIPDEEVNEVKNTLVDSLNIKEKDLKSALEKIAKSAFSEYLDMIVGVGMPSRIIDIQQARIIKLIYYYYGALPTEDQISKVFNITKSKAKTLLNNIKSVYRNQLKEILKESIRIFLKSGQKAEDNWEFIISSRTIIQELNEYLELRNPGLASISNKVGSIAKAIIPNDTYEFLCKEYGVDIEVKDE